MADSFGHPGPAFGVIQSLHTDLQAAIAAGGAFVVVGSGVSIGATQHEPASSWAGLLRSGVERCVALGRLSAEDSASLNASIGSPDPDVFMLAAGLIEQKLRAHEGEYARWLRESVGELRARDPSVLQRLAELNVPLATTNYDHLLEEVTGLPAITWQEPDSVERWLRRDEHAILHLHGHWQQPDSIVLGQRSYDRVTLDEHAQAVLRALWLTRTPIFVGCGAGLSDPNFSRLLEWAGRAQAASGYRRYVLCTTAEQCAHQHEDSGLYPVAYGDSHAELAPFLERLKSERARDDAGSPSSAPRSGPGLPAIWNLSEPRCLDLVGRDELLAQLHEELTSDRVESAVQVLRGLGGMGKSALAREYAYRYADHYEAIWWLRAGDAATLAADYAGLGRQIGLACPSHAEETIRGIRAALSQRRNLLLVFDNASEPRELLRFLPQGPHTQVLITTRSHWSGAREHLLEPIAVEDAAAYLLRATEQDAPQAARAIAVQLGGLPLALVQAAAYVRECREALVLYQLRLEANGPTCMGTIGSMWSLSLDAVQTQRGGTELLNLCAFFAPDAIDLLDLRDASQRLSLRPGDGLPEPLPEVLDNEILLNRAKKVLLDYSLASATLATMTGRAIRLHRLVQAVTRQRLGAQERRHWLGAALRCLDAVFPEELNSALCWPVCDRLLGHARSVSRRASELYGADWRAMPGADSAALGHLLNHAGLYLKLRGSYNEAELMYRTALQVGEVTLGHDPLLAKQLSNLALLLCARVEAANDDADLCKSRLKEAQSLLFRALRISVRQARQDRAHAAGVARDLNSLGILARARQRYGAALRRHHKALLLNGEVFGHDHPLVARDLNNLGIIYRLLGRHDEAFQHHERSLRIFAEQQGTHGPTYAIGLRNFARLLFDMKRPADARRHCERAHAVLSEKLGDEHPDTLKCKQLLQAMPEERVGLGASYSI
jgi:tetratricopeptide (TPR) repeat protein